MSQIHSHSDNVIDISDSDDEQAVVQLLQPQTRPLVAVNRQPDVPRQAPVALSGMAAAVSNTAKPTTCAGLRSIPSGIVPVPRTSPNRGTAVARKPLMKVVDQIDLTLSSDEDETTTLLPSRSAPTTHPAIPCPQPHFIQPGPRSPPSAPLPTQKDPAQSTPTHNRRVLSPAASPGLGVTLVPGCKKRKRQVGGNQPSLLGFNDDHDESTSNPSDPNPDLPTKKRARLSRDGPKPVPAPAEYVRIRGLALLKKAAYNDIGKGAPNTGPILSEKENKVKGLRKKGENQAAAPTRLRRSYLPSCEKPEKDDAVITPADIGNILRTVTSDDDADEPCMEIDVDMSGDPPPRGRSPTAVQRAQTPQPPPLEREESVTSQRLSQRTESTQDVIDVLNYELNLFGDEESDADLQRALQLDCEMHSSPTHPTVFPPSVIELDDTDHGPSTSYLPYGIPGGSWQCHDLTPNAEEAASFIGEYLYGPRKTVLDVGETTKKFEEHIPDPFAPHIGDLHRQTIQEQLRVWAENPWADVSSDLADELLVTRGELAVRMEKQKLVEDIPGVSRPHEKGDIEKFIELDLKPIPSLSEGTLDDEGVIPESPEVAHQSTPEERVVDQATVMSPSGISGSGSSRFSTTPGGIAIIDSDVKASDEGAGTSQTAPLLPTKPEPQEPILPQRSAPNGVHISTTGSESTHQQPTAPSKRTEPTPRLTQSSGKVTELAIEDLEGIMLKRLNLTTDALAPRHPPVWERLAPLRPRILRLRAEEVARLGLEQEPEPNGVKGDEP